MPQSSVSKKALGTLLVSVSATAFGFYSYFALMAVNAGIGPVPLLFYRFGLASLFLAAIAFFGRSRLPAPAQVPGLILLGFLYVGQSFSYIQCLRASNPITASLLLYLYPAFVTLGSVLFLHERLTKIKVVALLAAFLGSILIVGPIHEIGIVAVAYGLGTATFYAAYLVAGKYFTKDIAPASSTLVILLTAMVLYGCGSLYTGLDQPLAPIGWLGVAGLALVATVVAIGGLIFGLQWVSPVEAASLSALEPLVAAIVAITLMGQEPKLGHLIGGLLVVGAVLLLARRAVDA